MSTYTPIASITPSGSISSVTFNNIPQTYNDLMLVTNLGSTSNLNLRVQLNGSSGSYYSATQITGNGTTASSDRTTNQNHWYMGYNAANQRFNNILQIMNYASTSIYKTGIWRRNDGGTGQVTAAAAGLWRGSTGSSTEAITSITLFDATSVNFTSNTTFNLYGISSAIEETGKAIGGDSIYSDGTYWYHIFNSSGTFTPKQSLTADYLVVAGGGGGGTGRAGGGGAGGFRTSIGGSALSLTSQAYTVTVGAGGAAKTQGSNSIFSTITSTGGGNGGDLTGSSAGNGGSGGGGAGDTVSGTSGGTGTAGQGNNGGIGRWNNSDPRAGGGGGGAGGPGGAGVSTSTSTGGGGGSGSSSIITGFDITYAGGGGGGVGAGSSTPGSGGTGGGGTGSKDDNAVARPGTANLGGGGGGGGGIGGAGGSGIVVIRYAV